MNKMNTRDKRENEEWFKILAKDYNSVVKPVIVKDEIIGYIIWNGRHTLIFFDKTFENTDVQSFGNPENYNIYFEQFLKYSDEWIKEIEQELKND